MDGVRGLAVILVFFVHFHSNFGEWAPPAWRSAALWLADAGHSGVDLFFALSGFLIYGILVERRPPLLRFWRRRIQRLYPTFAAVLVTYVALSALFPERSKIPPGAAATSIYLLQNALLLPGVLDLKPIITVAWSLSYEIFFYLGLPLVVWISGGLARMAAITALAAAAMMFVFSDPTRYYPAIPFSPLVLIGFLLFLPGIVSWELRHRNPRIPALGLAGLLIAIAGVAALLPRGTEADNPLGEDPWRTLTRTLIVAVSLTPFARECFAHRGWLARAFEWKPLRLLGAMSYSFYLAHSLALHALAMVVAKTHGPARAGGGAFLVLLLAAFATAVAASLALFLGVELPFSLRKTRASRVTEKS